MKQLSENSLFSSPEKRVALVEDKEATMTALIINLFGTLGLLKIDAKKVKARRVLNGQEQLQIGKIAETHNDMVLVIRLGVDSGIVPVPVAAQMIRLLRELRRKKAAEHADIDDEQLREWLTRMHWRSNPPVIQLRSTVLDFFEGLTTLEEFTARLYDKLFERKELIILYGMEFFPIARQYQRIFAEIKANTKDWNAADDGADEPVSVEDKINDLIDQLVDSKTSTSEVKRIGAILSSFDMDKEIAEKIIARTVPSKATLEVMETSEAFSSLKQGAWSVLGDLDPVAYATLYTIYVSLHAKEFWPNDRSTVDWYFSFSVIGVSFEKSVIDANRTIAGMTIKDAHKRMGDYIRRMIVDEVVKASSVDAWLKLHGYFRDMAARRFSSGLGLFDEEGLYRATVELSLSDKDTAMFFVRGAVGDVSSIGNATYNQTINSVLKKQGIEIDHVAHTVKGVDEKYPDEIQLLNDIAVATKSGYTFLYAGIDQNDEYAPLVSAFAQGFDGLSRALTEFLKKFESDPDDAFADLFGTQKYSRDITDPAVAGEFFASLEKHPRLKEVTRDYVRSLLGTRNAYINDPRAGFLVNFHKQLFPTMLGVDFSTLYRKTPVTRDEAREIEGYGRFVYQALAKPHEINVMDVDEAKLLATAFHAANPTSILAYYDTELEGFDSGYLVEWTKGFIQEIPTNQGLQIESFMNDEIARGLDANDWIRILTVFTDENEKTTKRKRASIILKGMGAGVKFGNVLPHDLYVSFIMDSVASGSGDIGDFQNVLDGLSDQHIKDITSVTFASLFGEGNMWTVSSFMTRNLQHPVARQHFIKMYQESNKKDDIRDMLSHEATASFLPKEESLIWMKINQAQAVSIAEKFSHLWTGKVFLKREDITKEDVEAVLGILVKAIGQYDDEYGNRDPEEYYDEDEGVTSGGAVYTAAELITLVMDKYPAEVDSAISTVSGTSLVKQVVTKIVQSSILERFSASYQNDIIKPYKEQTQEEILRSMRFNRIGFELMNEFYDPKKTLSQNIEASENLNVVIEPLKVTEISATKEQLIEATAMIESFNKHAHSSGQMGALVLRMFDVSIPKQHAQWPEFTARMQEEGKPNDYMPTVFHGTGSVAASMILRYGFSIPEYDAEAGMSGRALGDGVYFTNVSDKATLYIGDDGYKGGSTGYLFEMDAQLGQPAEVNSSPHPDTDGTLYNHRSGGFATATNHRDFISPEWAVFDPHGQVRIRRAYEVKLVHQSKIAELLNGNASYSAIAEAETKPTTFGEFKLMEAEGGKEKHTATYIFADGMVPVSKGKAVPWTKASIKGVRVESGQQGVIISVTSSRVKEDTIFRDCSGGEFALSSDYGQYAHHLGLKQ